MCGIAGIVCFDDQPIDQQRLKQMLRQVRHRGPDGEAISVHGRCGLVHARLSILDPDGGHQPMHLSSLPGYGVDSSLHLVFNGEIYNHRELRRELTQSGCRFQSDHCDTEVVLAGFGLWGTDLFERLEGMFAVAIWDQTQKRLWLARDRSGKKPLYFRKTEQELMFGSLVATLVAASPDDCRPGFDTEAMLTYLRFGYSFDRSMIEGIEQVPAASWMEIGSDGQVQCECFWQVPVSSASIASVETSQDLGWLLEQAVAIRMEADVPLGCFLSGGIDSSIIATLAQRACSRQGADRLRTFTVAMSSIDYDESDVAAQVARQIDTEHTILEAAPTNVIEDLNTMIAVAGEPTADSSLLPTYWLCQATRKHVGVVLSGEGGDELFGGYDRYRALRLLAAHQWWLQWIPLALFSHTNPRSRRTRVRRLLEAARSTSDPAKQYQCLVHLFTADQIRVLWPDGGQNGFRHLIPVTPASVPDWDEQAVPVEASMRWDRQFYLPHALLRKVDRASMAVGLEVRCPMLDRHLCEWAAARSASVLIPGRQSKHLLRTVAAELGLPSAIVNRPKQGFAVPIGDWFRSTMKDSLAEHLFSGELERLGLALDPIRIFYDQHVHSVADHSHRLFSLLQLVLWSRWIKDPQLPFARDD